jgi:anti-sigma B factor antagonist
VVHLDQTLDVALKPVPIGRAVGELLSVIARGDARCLVVAVHGEVDGTTGPLLQDRLLAHLRATRHLIADLGGVSFFGAAGLTVLVVVREAALLANRRLCVVARTRQVCLPLMITGLDGVLDLHRDLARALVCPELPAGPRLGDPRQPGDLR